MADGHEVQAGSGHAGVAGTMGPVPLIVLTVFIGAIILVIYYVLQLFRPSPSQEGGQKHASEPVSEPAANEEITQDKHVKASKARKLASKDAKASYAHPWLAKNLKGHTGPVLDFDFSPNGKYLASCSEGLSGLPHDPGGSEPEPEVDVSERVDSDSSSQPSASSSSLSRRQRKNRTKKEEPSKSSKRNKTVLTPTHSQPPRTNKSNKTPLRASTATATCLRQTPLKHYTKLPLSDGEFYEYLQQYLLGGEQLLTLGFPVDSSLYPGKAVIFMPISHGHHYHHLYSHNQFDVNAREFVPSSSRGIHVTQSEPALQNNDNLLNLLLPSLHSAESSDNDSRSKFKFGEDSEDSDAHAPANFSRRKTNRCPVLLQHQRRILANLAQNQSSYKLNEAESFDQSLDESLDSYEFVKLSNEDSNAVYSFHTHTHSVSTPQLHDKHPSEEKKCVRCAKGFFLTYDGEYLTQESCIYHWGKLCRVVTNSTVRFEYNCCRGRKESKGCTTAKLHVWSGLEPGMNGPFDSFARTKPRKSPHYGIYALDCEMCYTDHGLALTKVTVVGVDGRLVYETLVVPDHAIIDYNSRFSGLREKDMAKATKTLKDVQNDLMGFISAETILIGHALENDLRALRMIHPSVIDTAVLFPHYYGLPYRRSLKSLVGSYLKRDIQQGPGHDSFEDARASMELVLWKVRKDLRHRSESSS